VSTFLEEPWACRFFGVLRSPGIGDSRSEEVAGVLARLPLRLDDWRSPGSGDFRSEVAGVLARLPLRLADRRSPGSGDLPSSESPRLIGDDGGSSMKRRLLYASTTNYQCYLRSARRVTWSLTEYLGPPNHGVKESGPMLYNCMYWSQLSRAPRRRERGAKASLRLRSFRRWHVRLQSLARRPRRCRAAAGQLESPTQCHRGRGQRRRYQR